MYAEDMDLCFRVLKAGFRVYHVPTAEVVHHGGESSSVQGSSFSAVMMCEALYRYFVLNYGRYSAWTYRSAVATCAIARLLVLLPGLVVGRLTRKATFLRWRAMLSWCCGGQKWTKRYTTTEPTPSEV
jgi:GT2 family glycosyltransferase